MTPTLAVAMSTYFNPYGHVKDYTYRRELWKDALQSLSKVNWYGQKPLLVLRDDASAQPPTFTDFEGLGMDVDFRIRPIHSEELNANYWECIWDAAHSAEWVLMMDDDGLVCSDIISRLWGLVEQFPTSVCYGSYNSPYWPTAERYDGYVLKPYTTELGMLFRGADITHKGSSLLATILHGRSQELYPCLAPSAMQHRGSLGLNNPVGDDFDWEFHLV